MTQKTRILNLENELKQLKNLLKTFTDNQNANTLGGYSNPDSTPQHHMDSNSSNKCCFQRVKEELIEHRLRSLEQQVVHNMCINTALTTQIAIQAQSRHYQPHPHLQGYPYQWNIPSNMPRTPVYQHNMYYPQHNPYPYVQAQPPYQLILQQRKD